MPDLATLKRHKCSAQDYKQIWTKDYCDLSKPQQKLRDLIRSNIYDGRQADLKEWRAIQAIDLAYETPFNQTAPTIIQNIISKGMNEQEILAELRNWDLSWDTLLMKVPDDKGNEHLAINPPVLYGVLIPLAKAYTTMRLANLFNQRNANPLLLYQPLKMTEHDQVLCEIVTDMVNTVSTWYGYPATLRQAIQQMLKYGIMLAFPREEWDCQRELVDYGDGRGEVKNIIREGIRYYIPHPTRMFYDLKYPLTSLNSDTGTEFVGAWRVTSYGEIFDNKLYYNRSKIFAGTNWFQMDGAGQYFQEVYPCSMKFPHQGFEANRQLREDKAAWYSTGDRDQSVFLTDYFRKLIPRQFGLSDYPYPLWHRFVVAGDDTVIWCEPCAYTPSWFMGYDYDENAAKTSSMALECVPWQTLLGNVLTQMILTAQQNLNNIVFYDEAQVSKSDIEKQRVLGSRKYRETTWIGFDSMKKRMAQQNVQGAFFPVPLPKVPISEQLQLIPTVLNIMERVLQITAQESGGAASHQQSKAEIEKTSGASNSRVMLTFSYVDEGIDAWKRQQFDANMAYRSNDVEAQVSADIPNLEQVIKELGFEITRKGTDTVIVKGKKSKIRLEHFARTGEGQPLEGNKEAAQSILSIVQTVCGQEDLHLAVGSKNLLALLEWAGRLMGAPRDLRLREVPKEEQQKGQPPPPNVIEAIQAAQKALMQTLEEKALKPIASEMSQDKKRLDTLEQTMQQLQKIYDIAAQTQDKNVIKSQDAAATIKRKDGQAARDQQRKDAALAAEQRRLDAKAQAEHQREIAKTTAEIKLKEAESLASVEIKKKEAANKSAAPKANQT